MQPLYRDPERVVRLERAPSRQALVGHDAEGVHVTAWRRWFAQDLFGREVGGRSEHVAVGGQGGRAQRSGDAEVSEHQRAVRTDQQVARLDVAMDHALLMRALQRVGGLGHEVHGLDRAEATQPAQRGGQ